MCVTSTEWLNHETRIALARFYSKVWNVNTAFEQYRNSQKKYSAFSGDKSVACLISQNLVLFLHTDKRNNNSSFYELVFEWRILGNLILSLAFFCGLVSTALY